MSLNASERKAAARNLALDIFGPEITANVHWDDLTAAIAAIDDSMDALPAALNSGLTVKQNLIDRLPEPFKSTSTVDQKAAALTIWAMKTAGVI